MRSPGETNPEGMRPMSDPYAGEKYRALIVDEERLCWEASQNISAMRKRQEEADERRRAAFFSTFHKLNAAHLAQMQAPPQAVSSEARQLISILRDTTQSRSTYDRCVAIVGEGR